MIRCDSCGKFISYASIESGKAKVSADVPHDAGFGEVGLTNSALCENCVEHMRKLREQSNTEEAAQ